jgi:hypothetical protein
VWNPSENVQDARALAPVVTPAYPSMNSTHNISYSTLGVLQSEWERGKRVLEKISKLEDLASEADIAAANAAAPAAAAAANAAAAAAAAEAAAATADAAATTATSTDADAVPATSTAIVETKLVEPIVYTMGMTLAQLPSVSPTTTPEISLTSGKALTRGEALWHELCEPSDFFLWHKDYLSIVLSAASEDDAHMWKGYVESKLRQLIAALQRIREVRCFPYPYMFPAPTAEAPHRCSFYFGLEFSRFCECSSLHSAHANLTINMQLYTLPL